MRRLALSFLLVSAAATAHAAVTGTVVSSDAAPLAGARVRAFAREPFGAIAARLLSAAPDPAPLATAQSDAEGRFSIDTKGNATVDVVVDAAGHDSAALYAADGDDAGAVVLRDAGKTRRIKVTLDGKPLPNALVYLGHALTVRTAADGTFDGAFSGEASYVIHPDYGVSFAAENRDGEIPFHRGTAVRGRVVARDGKTPVAGATILAGGWPLARSGDDGAFSIAHAPARLRAFVAVSGTDAGAAALLDPAKPLEIRLGTAASLSGSVTGKGTAPVAGATVLLTHEGELYSAVSDAKGRYAIAALPAGSYAAQAIHPAYVTARGGEIHTTSTSTHAFTLAPRSRIRGTVVDEDRKPVAGAFVGLAFGANSIATTTPAGEFTLRLAGINPAVVFASKSGYATAMSPPLNVAPGETKSGVALTLPRGFPLQIKVVDAGRQPVANANVEIFTGGGRDGGYGFPLPCSVADRARCRTTGADGTVETRIAEGKYALHVSGDFLTKTVPEQALTARSSPLVVTVERGADVSGRVVYSDGTPVAEARVNPMGGNAAGVVTDANGAFTLKQLPRLAVSLVASTNDDTPLRSAPANVTPPARDVTLTIPAPARIEGRVIDRATSQPVTSFNVSTQRRGMGGGGRGADVTSDDGTFSLKHVQPGVFDLRVTAPGYVASTVSDLAVEEGKALTGVEVKLDRGARIAGHVTAGGSPALAVRVRAGLRSSRTQPSAVTDANGDYTLDGVPAGEVTVDFAKDGFVAKKKTIDVDAGKDVRLDVDLDRGREVRGRVNDKSGQPVSGARVSASTTSMPVGAGATSDNDGQFTISGLEDGRYRVSAQKNGYVTATIEDVDPAAAQPLTLTLDRGATLNGRVVGLPPEELGQVHIGASSRNGSSSAQADASGNFTLTGIPDGRVTVTAFRQGVPSRQSAPKTVEVMNGNAPTIEIDFSAGITIRGRVTRNGAPVSGGSVMFMPKARGTTSRMVQGMIAADGMYEVSGADPGDYDVRVSTMGAFNDAMPYTVTGNAVFDIDLRGASVRGVALDAATGAPLPDVRISASSATPGVRAARNAISDSDGRFTLDILPDGTFTVRGDREHYAAASQTISVSGGSAPPLELRLTRGSELAVRIVDATSGAAMDGTVTLVDAQRKYVTSSSGRGEDGATHVWAAPGRYTANVNASGYMLESIEATVPGPEVRVALTRAAALTLSSRTGGVFRLSSSEQAGGGRTGRLSTLRAGEHLTINNLRPGAMEVDKVTADGKTLLKAYAVVLVPGQTATLDAD